MARFQEYGTLVRWLGDKGFGFIKCDAGGPDAFAHLSDFAGTPAVGARVSFVLSHTDRGARASAIEALPDHAGSGR